MPALVNVQLTVGEGFNAVIFAVHEDPRPERKGQRILQVIDRTTMQEKSISLTPEICAFLRSIAS